MPSEAISAPYCPRTITYDLKVILTYYKTSFTNTHIASAVATVSSWNLSSSGRQLAISSFSLEKYEKSYRYEAVCCGFIVNQ